MPKEVTRINCWTPVSTERLISEIQPSLSILSDFDRSPSAAPAAKTTYFKDSRKSLRNECTFPAFPRPVAILSSSVTSTSTRVKFLSASEEMSSYFLTNSKSRCPCSRFLHPARTRNPELTSSRTMRLPNLPVAPTTSTCVEFK